MSITKSITYFLMFILLSFGFAQTNYSLDFDGIDDYVGFSDDNSLDLNTMTIEAWVKYEAGMLKGSIVDKRQGTSNDNFVNYALIITPNDEGANFFIGNGTSCIEAFWGGVPAPNEWHHLAGTYDGVTLKLYLDGVEKASTATSITPLINTDNLKVGKDTYSGGVRPFLGLIDEVRLWNRALSQVEIQSKMFSELNPSDETGLVGNWNFNEGTGTTANDVSGTGNNGTIQGATWSTDIPYWGPVWHVSTTGSDLTGDGSASSPFVTIQHGINVSSDGDTVVVSAGNYSGPMWIENKNISVISVGGAESTIISNYLYISNSDAKVSGFTLRDVNRGVMIYNGSSPVLKDIIIKNINQEALKIEGASTATVINTLIDSARFGFHVLGAYGRFINCTVTNCTDLGLSIRDTSGALFINSIVWGNGAAINYWTNNNIDSVTVYNSIFTGGWPGPGESNLDTDPIFNAFENSDFTLSDISPAIGGGADSISYQGNWYYIPNADIIGNPRPNPTGSKPDMGAYENPLAIPLHIPITINIPADYATIQAALNAADSTDTVLVQPDTYTENIFWPETNGIKLISAGDSSNTIIDGGGVSSVIYMNTQTVTIDTTTLIQGFKITNGGNVQNGGGILLIGASPKMKSLIIVNNIANVFGGGMYLNDYSNPKMINVTISHNISSSHGGGMCVWGVSIPTMINMTISDNNGWSGGGIYLSNSSNASMTNVTISNNSGTDGGGMFLTNISNPIMTNVRVTGNNAGWGGGILLDQSSPVMTNVIISNNSGTNGGGIYIANWNNPSNPTMTNVTIDHNSATNGGGVYFLQYNNPIINSTTINNNTAGNGGGIYFSGANGVTIDNIIITGNNASSGGGVFLATSDITINNTTMSENNAGFGGGLYVADASSLTMEVMTFAGNSANSGGGIYLNDNTRALTITQSTFVNNSALTLTGGIYIGGGNPTISNNNFMRNGQAIYNADNSNITQALNNYWGHSSGPYHPSQNSTGQGDSINVFVNVDPWLIIPNTNAPPIPAQNLMVSAKGNDFVSLAWDITAIGDLAGYKVYYDTDTTGYPYANSIDVGNVTTYTLSSLTSATSYYIAVTTYDADGNESWYSNEVIGTTRVMEVRNLDIGGDENLQHLVSHRPEITWDYYDSMDEPETHYQIQVSTQSNFSVIDKWNSGETAGNDTSIIYGGDSLVNGDTYYLRVKVASGDFWSDWSELQFRMNSYPTNPVLVYPLNDEVSGTPVVLKVLNSSDAENDTVSYSFNIFNDFELTTKLDSVSAVGEGLDTTSWQVTATLSDNGQYWWTVSANDGFEESAVSGPASFQLNATNDEPAAFALLSPTDSSEVDTVNPLLVWESAFDPDPLDTVRYTLYFDTPSPGVHTISTDTSTAYQIPYSLLDNTTYYWKVVASDLSGATTENSGGYRSFRVNTANDLPGDFTLLNPDNGSMVTVLTPNFHWEVPIDPDDQRSRSITFYDFYLGFDSSFSAVEPISVDTNQYTPFDNLAEDQLYYWKVIAFDDDGGNAVSDIWSFWTNSQNSIPSSFSVISPVNGIAVDTVLPTFTWHPSIDDDLNDMVVYNIYLGESIEDIEQVYTGFVPWITDTTFTLIEPTTDNTTYYWNVVATDLSGATRENANGFQTFNVNLGNESPSQVNLVAPIEGSIQTNLQPHFYWTEAVDPDPQDSIAYTLNWWPISLLPVIYGVVLDTNGYVPTDSLVDNSLFEWRVEARDLLDSTSLSDTSYFYTDAFPEPPLAYNTLFPPNNEMIMEDTTTLIWNSTTDPDPLDNVIYSVIIGGDYGEPVEFDTIFVGTDTSLGVHVNLAMVYEWYVVAKDNDNMTTYSNEGNPSIFYVVDLGIDNEILPTEYALHQNYPNPFNPITTIQYDLPVASNVQIVIYDLLGRQVTTIINRFEEPGYKQVIWNATNSQGQPVGAGMYFYQIKSGEFVHTRKMILLK